MPDPRIILTDVDRIYLPAAVTFQPTDDQYLSTWSKPDVPLLVYDGSEEFFATHEHRYHGGPIAGAAGGHPVQIIYWGDWWLTQAGLDRQNVITPATQRLLASAYWSWLSQYGIPHAPLWRGAFVCTEPAPPASGDLLSTSEAVVDLVQALIDDDKLPDPDDGPRICHVVIFPGPFTMTEADIQGAHWTYDKCFPFGGDRFWAGWVAPHTDAMGMMSTITHEIAEMLVDPESDAWRWIPIDSDEPRSELCDGVDDLSAFVNDVKVQAYWSEFHKAPIIPIDRDYGAQLHVNVKETGRERVKSGPFEPSNDFCRPGLPECCFEDATFQWHMFRMETEAKILINVHRFREPTARWSVNGTPITVSGPITTEVNLETYEGLTATIQRKFIGLDCTIEKDPPRLTVKPIHVDGNFSVTVSAEVRDRAIEGRPVVNVIATPHVVVGFRGAETLVDDAYNEQLGRCLQAMIRRYIVEYKPVGEIRPEEGINWVSGILNRGLPAYVTLTQYERIREFTRAARAANVLFGRGAAEHLKASIMAVAPVLGALERFNAATSPAVP